MDSILLIDKPEGMTSYDVIRRLKKQFPGKKIGHAGTLDPLASGLLLIGIGEGTKELSALVGLSKVYEVTALLGKRTATGDREGDVIEQKDPAFLLDKNIKNVVEDMKGEHTIAVPLYSAIKQRGEPLYKKARRGDTEVELPKKKMVVHNITFTNIERTEGSIKIYIEMHVSSGSYVRSLIEELGRKLSVPAMTYTLRRTKVGEYCVEDATSI